MTTIRTICPAIVALAVLVSCAQAQDEAGKTPDKAATEAIVHDYIMENPDVIEKALTRLYEERANGEIRKTQAIIADNQSLLVANPADHAIGPDDAPVTVVEFFDYRCGFCKRSADWVRGMPEQYAGKVRVVFKELPILSPESRQAALAALAAGRQGKYIDMHMALMALDNASGFTKRQINAAARSVGVNVRKMRADMQDPALEAAILDTKNLAHTLGIDGTPNFVIGTDIVTGAKRRTIETLIEDTLKARSPQR